MSDEGYIDYFAVLQLAPDCKPGEVRKQYKKLMKDLLIDISRATLTPATRDEYLLKMATLNAAFFILRDNGRREQFAEDRERVVALEEEWRAAAASGQDTDRLRRSYDGALRHFLSTYMEERMLEAGRDPECVEASHWDPAHERHAGRVLRHYRQRQYHQIHERLPFHLITEPRIDWDERAAFASELLAAGDR